MGWNEVHAVRDDALLAGLGERPRFYFVHSYRVSPRDAVDTLATTPHGEDFTSVVRRGNVVGAQFHPEKSHTFGMRLLGAFAAS
jgi:glutamine amidotransferase